MKSTLTMTLRRIALAGIVVLMISCERDFSNPNAPVVEDVPIQTIITGVEAGLRIDYAIFLRVVSVLGREAYYFEPADPRYTGELLQGTPDPGGFLLNRPWGARYRTIAACNILLEKAGSEGAASRAGIEGYAKTMMAYQLLLMLNYLDDNGIKLDFSGNRGIPFVSKADAFARIATLLDEGNASLGSAGSAFSFQLTSGFSGFNTPASFAKFNRALKARVSVYRGQYQAAVDALGGSFIEPAGSLGLGVSMVYGTGLGNQLNEIFEAPDAPFVKFMAHPSLQTAAEPGDLRFAAKTEPRSSATTFDNLTSSLAITITTSSTGNVPVIRNEELILLRAEARIGLSDYTGAESDMNVVRAAANLPLYSGTNAGNALDRLLHEKRYSLFGEGHRWVDMRRYGRLSQLPIDRAGRDVVLEKMPRPETEVQGG